MEIFILTPIFVVALPFLLMFFMLILLIPAQLIEEHYKLKRLKLGYEDSIIEEDEHEDELETVLYSLIEDSDELVYCLECQKVFIKYTPSTDWDLCNCKYSGHYTFDEIKKIINEHEDYKKYADYDIAAYYDKLTSAQEVYDKYEKFNEIIDNYFEEED